MKEAVINKLLDRAAEHQRILPNGATIIAIDYQACVVLAETTDMYVTWAFNADQGLRSTSNGHYINDLTEARDDFNERVMRGY